MNIAVQAVLSHRKVSVAGFLRLRAILACETAIRCTWGLNLPTFQCVTVRADPIDCDCAQGTLIRRTERVDQSVRVYGSDTILNTLLYLRSHSFDSGPRCCALNPHRLRRYLSPTLGEPDRTCDAVPDMPVGAENDRRKPA